ncbi:hypothetical protein CcaverHIS002_0308250 [Cutaneotrichosporon cavernicola]|uniref:Uncharacterized protein n=1 Tax=Cutaneotrichosporon cavernicola TaxID=279322 RepID=A0AA48L2V3_9TREE|nr:uncharacterized protein CcaverHIS019_0308130 [Cutaneotrichosporon cavernicola]BEI82957.1 hypothetical protein CcaverHIS002_0308250 [Cutaneotrichosporon cavernicola]BEI90743.1 hypothetical protein CcaverHIS019_0308130 [Cutaneotrichosporon cavernicola]BEI98523.1 hypothetical protein CcaverHIS631_0308220 [Cutaneotrichosporon cavernicola]BEJ06294.1 hypothetical protein CcaverHIS641_0308160 [Cutaneotrichosporon cavernicola]
MPPRKRVVKQVKKEKAEDVRPISEEEQEAEIAALRKNAQKDKATGRMYLDALLGFCLFVFIRQLHRYRSGESSAPTVLVLVTLAQTILLPFSVTPERLPVVGRYLAGYHHLVVLAQLILFVGSFVLQVGRVPIPELLRAAMPELLAFSVETQRRAERSNDAALDKLERLKYPLKGA